MVYSDFWIKTFHLNKMHSSYLNLLILVVLMLTLISFEILLLLLFNLYNSLAIFKQLLQTLLTSSISFKQRSNLYIIMISWLKKRCMFHVFYWVLFTWRIICFQNTNTIRLGGSIPRHVLSLQVRQASVWGSRVS